MIRGLRVTLAISLLVTLSPAISAADVFSDDFNRPDAPLGSPWETLESPLYIQSQHVVADSAEYGLVLYDDNPESCQCRDAAVEIVFNFASDDDDDGRFQIYLGGDDGRAHWGFIGKIRLSYFSVFTMVGGSEIELQGRDVDLSLGTSYRARLEYSTLTGTILLSIRELGGALIEEVEVAHAPQPLPWCAIGIENPNQAGFTKWLDDAVFEYCCPPTPAPEGPTPETWSRVKCQYRRESP